MSWTVRLLDPGTWKVVIVPIHFEGGIVPFGGSPQAQMTVTYNYSSFYDRVWPGEGGGFRGILDGKVAKETVDDLRHGLFEMGMVRVEDYWERSSGNAGHVLSVLLLWAYLHPDAVWEVS